MTYYDILCVDPSVEQGAIRKAYLKLSLKHHPDKNPNNVEEAKNKFIEIGTGECFVWIISHYEVYRISSWPEVLLTHQN